MPTTYDAVIVGARVAGSGTALHLARSGASVLVLDRAPAIGDTLSTHALLRAGVLQLRRWGVLDAVVAAGTPPARRTTFHLADGDLPITLKPAAGVDAFYAPRRSVLDAILVGAAEDAGADVRLGVGTAGLVWRDGRVVGVRTVDRLGREETVEGGIVIGADGRRSSVASATAAPVERAGRAAGAFVYGYVGDLDVEGFHWWFRHGGSAGAVPTNFGETCVFAGGAPAELLSGSPLESLRAGLARTAPELLAMVDGAGGGAVRGVRSYAGEPGYLRRAWGDGWALVGDAGYLKDAITAHGISDALRDAELLARAVLAAESCPTRLADELAAYQAMRDRLSIPLFDVAEELAGHRWSSEGVRELLLRASSATTDEVDALVALDAASSPTRRSPAA